MGRADLTRRLLALFTALILAASARSSSASITLELTLDGFGPGDGKSLALTPADIGNPTTLAIWATVAGNDASHANEGLQSICLDFRSIGGILGNLANATHTLAFAAVGSQDGAVYGTPGDYDLGSLNPANVNGWWIARAGTPQSGTGPSSNGLGSFKLGTITFTPTSVPDGADALMKVDVRAAASGALWFEDATVFTPPVPGPPIWSGDKTATTGTILYGAPIAVVPEPAALGLLAFSATTLLKRRRNPAN